MKTLELGLCIFFSSLLFSCNADDLLTYRFGEYLKYENIEPKSLRDSVDQYIFCISEKIKNDAPCWYFPQINSVDVSFHMSTIDGDTYLGGLGDFIIPFAKSSYKLLAAGTYLRYTDCEKEYLIKYYWSAFVWMYQIMRLYIYFRNCVTKQDT